MKTGIQVSIWNKIKLALGGGHFILSAYPFDLSNRF